MRREAEEVRYMKNIRASVRGDAFTQFLHIIFSSRFSLGTLSI